MNSAAGGAEAAAAKKKKKKRKKKGDPYALAVPKPTGPQPSRSVWDAVLGVNSPRRNGDNAVGLTGAAGYSAQDIWAGKSLGKVTGTWKVGALTAHDSAFVRFSR